MCAPLGRGFHITFELCTGTYYFKLSLFPINNTVYLKNSYGMFIRSSYNLLLAYIGVVEERTWGVQCA
jgi:hypothetical protein